MEVRTQQIVDELLLLALVLCAPGLILEDDVIVPSDYLLVRIEISWKEKAEVPSLNIEVWLVKQWIAQSNIPLSGLFLRSGLLSLLPLALLSPFTLYSLELALQLSVVVRIIVAVLLAIVILVVLFRVVRIDVSSLL